MAQEDHNQSASSSGGCGGGGSGGGGNRSSKKLKQKKVPQRGLGVAQLEKIRLEEQQKIDVQCAANFRHNPSPSSIPLHPPPPPTSLSPPNSIFRPPSSIPNIDFLHQNGGGGDRDRAAISGLGRSNWPKLWNGQYNLDGENQRLDHLGFEFQSRMNNSPYESNPIWPPPNLKQKTQQFQQQPSSSSSMVNVSSGTSSSSMISYHQMEPPSNQSFYGNNYTPLWPEEEKMVGMKRPYPFSPDNPPGPSFPCKFPPISRSNESASCGNGGTIILEPSNPIFREGPSSTTSICELNPKKVSKENKDLNGDFLTLAPPSAYTSPHSRDLSEFKSIPCQLSVEDLIHYQRGPSGSTQKQPLYNFFPSEKTRISQATTTLNGGSGGGEKLDLNLKL